MHAAFFAALMPDERTSARIQRFKDCTRELVGPQLYLDDPPHTTVYLASFPIGFDAIAHLRAAVIPAPSPVRLHGWHSWVGDPLTGRNTLVCSLHPDDKQMLRLCQQHVVAALAPHRDLAMTEARFAGRADSLSAEQTHNIRTVGFPFLGDGWEPHITVASIAPEHWDIVLGELQSCPPFGPFSYTHLEVFKLHGDEPTSRGRYEFPAH